MFEHVCIKIEELERGIVDNLREEINNHLQALESEIQRYFPEFSEQVEVHDEFWELRSVRDLFQEKSLP